MGARLPDIPLGCGPSGAGCEVGRELFRWPFTETRGCHRYERAPGARSHACTSRCGDRARAAHGEPARPLGRPASLPWSVAAPPRVFLEPSAQPAGASPSQGRRGTMEPSAPTKAGSKQEEGFGAQPTWGTDLGPVLNLQRSSSSLCKKRGLQFLLDSSEKVSVQGPAARSPQRGAFPAGQRLLPWGPQPRKAPEERTGQNGRARFVPSLAPGDAQSLSVLGPGPDSQKAVAPDLLVQ